MIIFYNNLLCHLRAVTFPLTSFLYPFTCYRHAPLLVLTDRVSAAKAAAMPHFLDWFVPVYLFISVLILVGFGACIYYFEPGLQEAHKWRMQRPLVDRDFRKTLMVRDNLAFGGPEV